MRVLVIDDEKHIREKLREILRKLGHDERIFDRAKLAHDFLLCAMKPDVILCDVKMSPPILPDVILSDVKMSPLNGIGFARLVRSSNLKFPIIFMVEGDEERDELEKLGSGFLDKNKLDVKHVELVLKAFAPQSPTSPPRARLRT